MEYILSEQNLNVNEPIIDKIFVVNDSVQLRHLGKILFKNCRFRVKNEGFLNVGENVSFESCIFEGTREINVSQAKNKLNFQKCETFKDNRFYGAFHQIYLNRMNATGLKDKSNSHEFHLYEMNIYDSTLLGNTNYFFCEKTLFKSEKSNLSIFNKKIQMSAECKTVSFVNVLINPNMFATKCANKDSLDITNAILTDDWSKLRKKYAGLSLIIVIILTSLFFLPLFTHSFFLITVSKIKTSMIELNEVPLWKALLFGNKEGVQALIYSILTIVLILYNIGRIYMTISISKLREEERFLIDSNFKIRSINPDKYNLHVKIDKALSLMFWVSIIYSLFKLYDTLMINVPDF